VIHAVTPPTVLGRTDTGGTFFLNPIGPYRAALGLLIIGVLCGLAALAWRGRGQTRAVARLALVTLVLLLAGLANGINVPRGIESARVNLYRWTWTAAFLTWMAIGIGVALLVDRLLGRGAGGRRAIRDRMHRLAPIALVVMAALIATAIVFVHGEDDRNPPAALVRLDQRVADAVLARVDRSHPVVVAADGFAASTAIAPYVIFRLVEAGIAVEVPPHLKLAYGNDRRFRQSANPSAIYIVSGERTLPSAPGAVITRQSFSPERTALVDELTAVARRDTIELAPGAHALVDREYDGLLQRYVDALLARLPTDPRTALAQPLFLRLVLKGILLRPVLDEAKVRRLIALRPELTTVGGDEQVAVHVLGPDEVRHAALPGVR
jgi:hypothetical protein